MNHHTIIEVPAGKHFFTIEELPRLFADSVPDPADSEEGNWAVRIVMAQSEFLPLIEAAAVDGSLPALDPFTRLPARHPKGFNAKRLLVTLDAFRDFASKHGFDVREKAEPLQAQQAPIKEEGSAGTKSPPENWKLLIQAQAATFFEEWRAMGCKPTKNAIKGALCRSVWNLTVICDGHSSQGNGARQAQGGCPASA
ncbi:MAG: hypothetical protein FJ209_11330 [Betaproteobacteria bacterium]|nr:hypothetical protein [Betaproteobacteria bacterium]